MNDEFMTYDDTMRVIGKWLGRFLGFVALCAVAGFIYGRWIV